MVQEEKDGGERERAGYLSGFLASIFNHCRSSCFSTGIFTGDLEGEAGEGARKGGAVQQLQSSAFICHGNLVGLSHSSDADGFSRQLYHCGASHCVRTTGVREER